LSLGADVNAIDDNGETAMHGAGLQESPKDGAVSRGQRGEDRGWNRKNKYGWTPLLIAQGFRPGNFKPSAETIEAIEGVMRADVSLPRRHLPAPPKARRDMTRLRDDEFR
jgi:hypothetical protein